MPSRKGNRARRRNDRRERKKQVCHNYLSSGSCPHGSNYRYGHFIPHPHKHPPAWTEKSQRRANNKQSTKQTAKSARRKKAQKIVTPEGAWTSHDASMRCSAEWRGECLRCGCRSHCRDGELVCRCDTCTSVLGNSCDYEYGRANRETTRCSVCWCTARFRDGDRTCWCDACTGGCMHPNLP